MSNFPSAFQDETQALPIAEFGQAAQEATDKLAAKGYEVRAGLTPELADKIIVMAQEPAIKEYCPNDYGGRFANRAAAETWIAKQRGVFLLFKNTDGQLTLAGYGWVGGGTSPEVPGGQTTFAIRIGEVGQGQGLAKLFTWLMLAASAVMYGARDIWLETWQSNVGAVHVYHSVGFIDVNQKPSKRPTLAEPGTVDDVRLYMSLPDNLLPGSTKDAALSSDS